MLIHRFAKRIEFNDVIVEDTLIGRIRYTVQRRFFNEDVTRLVFITTSSNGPETTFLFDPDDIVTVEVKGYEPDPLAMLKQKAA